MEVARLHLVRDLEVPDWGVGPFQRIDHLVEIIRRLMQQPPFVAGPLLDKPSKPDESKERERFPHGNLLCIVGLLSFQVYHKATTLSMVFCGLNKPKN